MKTETYKLKFLTPCFCGGENPSCAELRPSAIRGQLRWWFRAIGGTREEETEIFGGAEKEKGKASAIIVRTEVIPNTGEKEWYAKISEKVVDPKVYLFGFFCKRSNRVTKKGAIPPQTQFTITIIYRKQIPERLLRKYKLALDAFLSIGAIGYRATRTAGALTFREQEEGQLTSAKWNNLKSDLEKCGFEFYLYPKAFSNWVELCNEAGNFLKNKLRGRKGLGISAGPGGSKPNILGCSNPRQASVLHLRPVIIDQKLSLLLIEAPHSRIIGRKVEKAVADYKAGIIKELRRKKLI